MTEKTIKQFVDEFKTAFGPLEFTATNNANGQVVNSKGWQDQPKARLEISGADYLKLGKNNMHHDMPAAGVVSGLFEIVKRGI